MMPDPVESRVLYRGSKFDLEQVEFCISGRIVTRDIVRHPGAAVVLPVLDDGRYVLIRNRRIAAGGDLWELCAGTLEPGEPPEDCARRELVEETGFEAVHLERLARFYSSPGMSDELITAFCATGLREVGQRLEEDEEISVSIRTPAEVRYMIEQGELVDGKSLVAILLHEQRVGAGDGRGD